jgi:zinc protease
VKKKIIGVLAVAGLVGVLLFWGLRGERSLVIEQVGTVYEYTLGNGLKILVQPDRRSPVVVSQVWYKVGSSYEPEGITGISHMLEHMMFKGTDELKPGEFSEIIATNGGEDNAFTSRDYTAYFQRISSEHLELCLRLEADRMRDLLIDDQEFLKERDVVAEERRWRLDDQPQSMAYAHFMATAYDSGPYHHPIIGWMPDIQAYTPQAARDWYSTWYAPNNATLVVVGDVQPEQVHTLAQKYFGDLKPSSLPPAPLQTAAEQQEKRYSEISVPAKVPYVILGYKVPSMQVAADSNEVYALEVLAGVLDGGQSARLSRNLVRGSQLAASVEAGYEMFARLGGLLTLSAVPVSGVEVDELIAALTAEIERLQQEPVSSEELARVRAQVIASDVYERDSVFYQAMKLGILETVGPGWRVLSEYIERVQAVTPDQIQAAAQKYLQPERLTVTVLVPQTQGMNP